MSICERRCLVTGANGFVGKALAPWLSKKSYQVTALSRFRNQFDTEVNLQIISSLEDCDWTRFCQDQDAVIHLANIAHVARTNDESSQNYSREINVNVTLKLAKAAAEAGVKRFIYLSSIKVNGESTAPGQKISNSSKANPLGPYAESKHEAEQGLLELGRVTGLEVVVIRPPLIYGPGVKGNLRTLCNLIDAFVPLPLSSINNRRDLISIDNLCSLIEICLRHPDAPGKVFLCSDGSPLSTPDLIRLIARARGRKPLLFPFPTPILKRMIQLAGKKSEWSPLMDDMRVDISDTEKTLGWFPDSDIASSIQRAFAKEP